jgi:hypothetical protein
VTPAIWMRWCMWAMATPPQDLGITKIGAQRVVPQALVST